MVTTRRQSQRSGSKTQIDYRDAMGDREFKKMLSDYNNKDHPHPRGRKRRRESNEAKELEEEPPTKRRFTRSSLRNRVDEDSGNHADVDDDENIDTSNNEHHPRRSTRLAQDADEHEDDVLADEDEPNGSRRRSARLAKRATEVPDESDNGSPDYNFSGEDENTDEEESDDEDSDDNSAKNRRTSSRLQSRPRVRYWGDGEKIQVEGDDNEATNTRPKRTRRQTQRYQFPEEPTRRRSDRARRAPISRKNRRRAAAKYNESDDSSESDTSQGTGRRDSDSSVSTDTYMERRAVRRMRRDRAKINPINLHDLGIYDDNMAPSQKTTNADVSPMEIDLNVDWNSVGGLEGHVSKLKEMVVLPLLYRDEFDKFNMSAPKGVLFHGPPGTGKTLVARVLAAQCSRHGKKVSFYMRKGADCLSKWVGEAERQLRLLFDEAHKNQPAIIFFDEIDGLAPVRSSRQDQIHSSIVSTLLALMDGLDSRGQIIVIGATNRPDSIDPALRRPGRFDRELCFQLPGREARRHILKIHSQSWDPPIDDEMLQYLSDETVGYCGADLEALCREAFLAAIRRSFPQIYQSNVKLQIDPDSLRVEKADFDRALKDITPSSQRSSIVYARALPDLLQPLLQGRVDEICGLISSQFRLQKDEQRSVLEKTVIKRHHGRLLIDGDSSHCGQAHVGAATLHLLEEFPLYSLDLPNLFGDPTTKNAEEVCLRVFREAQRNAPSVVYWPHVDRWWSCAYESLQTSLLLLIQDIPKDKAIFLVATADCDIAELDPNLQRMFDGSNFSLSRRENDDENVHAFWMQLVGYATMPPEKRQIAANYPALPAAESPPQEEETSVSFHDREQQQKRDIIATRVFIRSVCNRLIKQFKDFITTMDVEEVVSNNLSLLDVRDLNNNREYPTMEAFLHDIDTIVSNVKSSANVDSLKARQVLNEACHLQDMALSMACQIDREMSKRCDELARQERHRVRRRSGIENGNPNSNEVEIENAENNASLEREERFQRRQRNAEENVEPKAEDMDVDVDDDSKEGELTEGKELEIDLERLNMLIDELTAKTVRFSVDELEDTFYRLLRIIYRYSSSWDRSLLVKELIRVTRDL